jgi:tetratricopeptide (TPR) repeat protein
LEKDVSRRYATVDKLGDDLRAYLTSRPIHAQPPSTFYILRKFAERHRGSVAASALVGLALTATLAFGAWQARQTHLEAARTKRVLTFLQNLIIEASPNNTGVQTITVLELLRQAPTVAQKQFPKEPELQFEVLKPVERILRDLEAAEALEPVERAMVKLMPLIKSLPTEDAAELLSEYGLTLTYLGKLDQADTSVNEAVNRLETEGKKATASHAVATMNQALLLAFRKSYDKAAELAMQSHTNLSKHVAKDDPRITKSAFMTIELLLNAEQLREAKLYGEKFFSREQIAAAPTAKERQHYRVLHASLQWYLGDPGGAELQYDELVKEAKIFFGEGDVVYPKRLHLAGRVAIDNGHYEKALRLLDEAVSIENKAAQPNRYAQIKTLSFATIAHLHLGQHALAKARFAQATVLSQQAPIMSEPSYWQAAFISALSASDYSQASRALDEQAKSLSIAGSTNVLARSEIEMDRANLFRISGNTEHALIVCKSAISALRARVPEEHYRLARADVRLAQLLAQSGSLEEAYRTIKSATAVLEKAIGNAHPLTLQSQFIRGQIETKLGNLSGLSRTHQAAQSYESQLKQPIDPKVTLLHG